MPNNDFNYTGGYYEPKWMKVRPGKVRVTPKAPRGETYFSQIPVRVTPEEPRGTVWFPIPVGETSIAGIPLKWLLLGGAALYLLRKRKII